MHCGRSSRNRARRCSAPVPAYIDLQRKAGVVPGQQFDLRRLESVTLAGSPVSAECMQWLYENVKADLWVASGSGGTDCCTGFVSGVSILPVYAGEIQARALGCAAFAFDEQGRELIDEVGELVLTQPMPSMPVKFWNDPGDRRYLESYFDIYPGVWRHGDFVKFNQRGGVYVLGRSDSTLNRQGIRIGTAEIYRSLALLEEIDDALIVNLDLPGGKFFMPLFVKLRGERRPRRVAQAAHRRAAAPRLFPASRAGQDLPGGRTFPTRSRARSSKYRCGEFSWASIPTRRPTAPRCAIRRARLLHRIREKSKGFCARQPDIRANSQSAGTTATKRSKIDHRSRRHERGQWLAVLVTVGLNAMDGFDVLSISFASPGIAKDWGLAKDTLGWVLSMELIGMALGSVLLGGVADKIGRRPTILGCLLAMSVGMFGASRAGGVATLLVWRLLTGVGIGGMLASINAAAAELSNQRWRSLAVSLMVIGYPVGGVIGGTSRAETARPAAPGMMCSSLAAGSPPPSFPSSGSCCPNPWPSWTGGASRAHWMPSTGFLRALATSRWLR